MGEFPWTASQELSADRPSDRGLTGFYQWWVIRDEPVLQNRPQGWGFQGVTNGEIKYMKMWQVSIEENYPRRGGSEISPSLACSLEF